MSVSDQRLPVLEHRHLWRLVIAIGACLIIASAIWDGQRTGEMANALLLFGVVGIGWMSISRRSRKLRLAMTTLGVLALVELAYAVLAREAPVELQVALFGVAGAVLIAIAIGLWRLHRSVDRLA